MASFSLFSCLLLALFCQFNAAPIYSTPYAGLDVFPSGPLGSAGAMSYCANLISPISGVLWWTCDESAGNVRSGGFVPGSRANNSFWMDGQAPLGYPPTALPFVSMSSSADGKSVSGSSFPQTGPYQGLVIQTLTYTTQWTDINFVFPGFEVFAVVYGETNPATKTTEVYVAGWMNTPGKTTPSGFVVARGSLLAQGTSPGVTIAPEDISIPIFVNGCYDVYTSTFKPTLHIVEHYVVVLVPGRCQTFARWARTNTSTPFMDLKPDVLTPGTFGIDYVASSAMDAYNGNFYYILKEYNKPDSELWYVMTNERTLTRYMIPLVTGESTVSLVAGTDGVTKISYVYAFSPQYSAGSGRVERIRYNAPTKSLAHDGFGNLPGDYFLKASSFYYEFPYIYVVTNEPAGRLFRFSTDNICSSYCGEYAYCDAGFCQCIPNYSAKIDGNGCEPTKIHEEIINEKHAVGAAATLGVFWVISLFVAAFGWRAWYNQSRASPQAQHLTQEYNRPL